MADYYLKMINANFMATSDFFESSSERRKKRKNLFFSSLIFINYLVYENRLMASFAHRLNNFAALIKMSLNANFLRINERGRFLGCGSNQSSWN